MKKPIETFKTTAVKTEKGYHHFVIHPVTASLYGNSEEDIETVIMTIAENQEVIPHEKDKHINESDYWGWFNYDSEKFTMIYPKRFLLSMCFPSGIEGEESAGTGKAYRLTLNKF